MTDAGCWSYSDDLKFALFSDIIARNQSNVLNKIQNDTYNDITYSIDNSSKVTNNNTNNNDITINLVYNAAGQVEPGDGDNNGHPGQGNNGSPPGQGNGNNINTSV
jgi:hypothetical protein